MEVIYLHHPYKNNQIYTGSVVLAMGFFDGLHRGHKHVINVAKNEANKKKIPLAILTYDNHPSILFKNVNKFKYITPLDEKIEILDKLGVDIVYIVNFTSKLVSLNPQNFVNEYMIGLNAKTVVAGYNHTYGKKNADMKHLYKYAKNKFSIKIVNQKKINNDECSSTQIRTLLSKDDIEKVNNLLGRVYETKGIIVHGYGNGKKINFPTANIEYISNKLIPNDGIYITKIKIGDLWYNGMTSIGYNITFGNNNVKTIEMNIFNFNEEIYGENIRIKWYKYMRKEIKFSNKNNLIEQLNLDKKNAEKYFKIRGE